VKTTRKNGGQNVTDALPGSGGSDGGSWTLTANEARGIVLSRREIECLEWVARGFQDDRIAARLNISRSTVRLHLLSARRKLKAKTREQALVRAVQLKLIAP
jgi:DNA-binding CsgD family transcriptional regulator